MGIVAVGKAIAGRLSDAQLRRLATLGFSKSQAALLAAAADPRRAQEARLVSLMATMGETERGRALKLSSLSTLDAFRAGVPLSDWDSTQPYVDRMVRGERGVIVDEDPIYYATTSGTTGRRKLIPCTSAFVAECRVANRLLYRTMLLAMPGLVRGKRLSMRSPGTEKLNENAEAGSITVALGGGVDDENVLDAVPAAVFSVADFALRYKLALRFALQERITVVSAINPSTLALFAQTLVDNADALADGVDSGDFGTDVSALDAHVADGLRRRLKKAPDAAARLRASASHHGAPRMADVFPELSGLVTWKGGASSWWLQRLEASYGHLPTLDYGYAASEGCFGAPISTDDASSVLLPHGHLIELLPEGEDDPTRTLFLDEAKVGERYEVVVTTSAGLLRYRMYDVVEVTGFLDRAPLVVFRHKAGTMCSVTGEKLGESHVAAALGRVGFAGQGICLSPRYPEGSGVPYYEAVVERGAVADVGAFASALDTALGDENDEWRAKRESLRLGPLQVSVVEDGAFAAHRRRRVEGGAPDAHVKLPLLSPQGDLLTALREPTDAPSPRR